MYCTHRSSAQCVSKSLISHCHIHDLQGLTMQVMSKLRLIPEISSHSLPHKLLPQRAIQAMFTISTTDIPMHS